MSTFGIDLGTTYSCIATLDRNGMPEVIHNQVDASDTLASAIFFETADNIIIGNSAKDMIETDGDRVVQYVKREIGKDNAKTWEYFGHTYNAVEASALILKRLKQIAEEQGHTVDNVVITVPAYFGISEREATRQAGESIGLNVLNLINEPTAAALAFCNGQFQEDRTIMVYDLGGGTFDVTIVKMSVSVNGDGNQVQQVKVVASGGNDLLGGKDWDDLLFDHILNACCEENGLTPDDIDVETRQMIRSRVEVTKKKLTNSESAKVKIAVNGSMTNLTVTREEFESMSAHLVAQTMNYVESVLASVNGMDVDVVLLVGGSTYMPMIRNAVEARFPGKVQVHEPDRAVAMGAAICANMLVEDSTGSGSTDNGPTDNGPTDPPPHTEVGPGTTFIDTASRSFGPGILDSNMEYVVDNLIKKGADMPALAVKMYGTVANNQTKIELKVFEDMSTADTVVPCIDARGNEQPCNPADMVKYLGELEMTLPPNTPKGTPIEVTFQHDAGGVYVKAVNMSNGDLVETTINFKNAVEVDESLLNSIAVFGE